jgi:phage repressor protein C with HTH and peptisase S24 domain
MEHVEDSGWENIDAFRTEAALGEPAEQGEWLETHRLKFRTESIRRKRLNPDALGVVYGRGDSMLPRIKSGDAIMFDRRKTDPIDGALFVITYDGGLMAKRLIEIGGKWFIDSLNKDDPKWRKPHPVDENAGLKIHGKVVWIGSWED